MPTGGTIRSSITGTSFIPCARSRWRFVSRLSRQALSPAGIPQSLRVLIEQLPDKQACKIAVELLALAHDRGCERELAEELARTLDAGDLPDIAALRSLFGPDPARLPTVRVQLAFLNGYEALIGTAYAGEVA